MSARLLRLGSGPAEAYINPKAITAIWLEGGKVRMSLACGKLFDDLPYETPKALIDEIGARYREAKEHKSEGKGRKHHD